MAKDFKLMLHHTGQQTYFSGSVVSGTLSFSLSEPKSFDFVNVKLMGKAHVEWNETRTYTIGSGENETTHIEVVTYSANETYVEEIKNLWSKDESPNGKIGPGYYEYQFQFTMPPNCPPSFSGTYGKIEYMIHGQIKTGLFKFDNRVSASIEVSQIVNINMESMLLPIRQSRHKTVGFWCCAAGDVNFTVECPRSGFCVNKDTLPLTVHVENGSTRNITINASIYQMISYYAQGSYQRSKLIVARPAGHRIPSHTTTTVTFPDFRVPDIRPTILNTKILRLGYSLRVWAVIPWSRNPELMVDITLGNVPFQGDRYAVNTESQPPIATPFVHPPPKRSPLPPKQQTPSAPPRELWDDSSDTSKLLTDYRQL